MQGEMERLENDIALLGRAIVFPETPSLASRVRSQIERETAIRAPAPSWQLALTAVAAAAVALAFVAGVLAPARDAVADIFDRINIFETDEVPQDLTRDITGTELSFDEVQAAVGFPLLLPDGASPDRVLLQDFGQVKAAVLFYRHDNGAPYALFETNSQVGKGLGIGKGITDPGQAQPVSGLAGEAYWLTGLRIVQYYDVDGAVLQGSVRATDLNTLLWNENGRVFRIEGDLPKEDAIAIADSLR
jgi:Domain of unknown function (DUF4367)